MQGAHRTVLREKEKPSHRQQKATFTALCFMVDTWARHNTTEAVLNSGWRLAVSGGCRLAVGGGCRLAVGGGCRLAAVVGCRLVAVGGPWGLSLTKQKKEFLRTAPVVHTQPPSGPLSSTGRPVPVTAGLPVHRLRGLQPQPRSTVRALRSGSVRGGQAIVCAAPDHLRKPEVLPAFPAGNTYAPEAPRRRRPQAPRALRYWGGGGYTRRSTHARPDRPVHCPDPSGWAAGAWGGGGCGSRREERGRGGVWNPKVCVPKMARQEFPFCKFWFFPRWSLWSWGGGSRGGGRAGAGAPSAVAGRCNL